MNASNNHFAQTIAFLSMDDISGYVFDDTLAEPFLNELGIGVETISWRSQTSDWAKYAAVIIRTTWDYQKNLREFLKALAQINSKTLLLNPLSVVGWNADKVYLRELESQGINIVPTIWGEKISNVRELKKLFEELDSDEFVIKPTISAGADSTFWLSKDGDLTEAASAFSNLPYMIQPFMQNIILEGEFSVFYMNGAYSHTIQKTPKPFDFRVQEEHGGTIAGVTPANDMIEFSNRVMSLIPHELLYARVDIVKDSNNQLALMELELVEPALYLRMDTKAPARLAKAIQSQILNLPTNN